MNMDDYKAALNGAAIFELANTGIIHASGPDAASFLNNISTNDIVNLPVGSSCETYFCDHRAKVLFQAIVRHMEGLLIYTTPGYGEPLLKHLDKYLISEEVELEDWTADYTLLHLVGPDVKDVQNGQHRVGLTGKDIFARKSEVDGIREKFIAEGVISGSPETFEVLRIEAGTPIYGIDIDKNRFVMEVANAARAVCYTKGCFIGQEPIVMSRDRAGQVNRLFLGMKVLDGGPLAHGTKLFRDGVEVGIVTSSCDSPRLGAPLALGYLKRPHIEKGLILTAGSQTVEVLGYPPLGERGA